MSVIDNTRIIIKVCKLYYEENRSQKEISYMLGVSRPQISRILAHARSNNIVSIKINNPYDEETKLEDALVNQFKIKDALVINTNGLTGENLLHELGVQAGRQLGDYICDHDLVGVMSGKTISALVSATESLGRKGLEFIPLIGSIGSDGAQWHANAIAQSFAQKTGAIYYLLNTPVIVKSKEAKELLMHEPHIGNIIEKARHCDVAIVGIGEIDRSSTTVQAGALTVDEVDQLRDAGAVASVCTSYIDQRGQALESEITERSLGLTIEQLRSCKKVIAIAVGKSKIEAIKAVLVGGFIDVFITNIETANEIIQNLGGVQ